MNLGLSISRSPSINPWRIGRANGRPAAHRWWRRAVGRRAILGWGTELFSGGGDTASRLRAFDWAGHPLGAPDAWPQELRLSLGICLANKNASSIYWGPGLWTFYNDAWAKVPAGRRKDALGMPASEVWSDVWPVVGPHFGEVIRSGQGFAVEDEKLMMSRRGRVDETYWTYSLTPIFDAAGKVAGVLNDGMETTERVEARRAQAFLVELGDRLRDLTSGAHQPSAALATILAALGRRLGLSRAGYAEIDPDGVHCVVRDEWRSAQAPAGAPGRRRIAEFGAAPMAELLAGSVVASEDVSTDPRYQDARGAFAELGVRGDLVAPVVRNGRAIACLYLNDARPRRWWLQQLDLAREVAERIWVALDRAEAAARARASERRFSLIFEQSGVGLSEVDSDGRFVRINGSMARILGRTQDEAVGLHVADVTHEEDVAETRRLLVTLRESGDPYTLEKRYVKPDGSTAWVVTNVTRLTGDDGRAEGFFSVTTDVTERKEQERIRSWLLAELNHRVKNNLSTVQALARQTRASTQSQPEFDAAFDARLMALSRAHDLLMRETWNAASLGDILADTLAPYAFDQAGRVSVGGPEIRLSPTATVTLTLAFHELATNAAKFGAFARPEGRVGVAWTVDRGEAGDEVALSWRESGGPAVTPPARRGFGLRLIERGAARELGGAARVEFEPGGVACAFQIPLSQKVFIP